MRRKSARLWATALALLLALLGGCRAQKAAPAPEQTQESSAGAQIDIPGYNGLAIAAGTQEQVTDFYNPENNACLFRITLRLEDELLWQSELLRPGERVERITLTRPLEAGDYPAALVYECYTMEERSPLNGAEIQLTLRVR